MIYKEKISDMLKKSKKPVLIVGAGCDRQIFQIISKLNIPFLLTWGAKDYVPWDYPNNLGIFGIMGKQINNYILKYADLIISVGARLDTHEVTGNWRTGKLIMIDIDEEELNKQDADLKINGDSILIKEINTNRIEWQKWKEKIKMVKSFEKKPNAPPYKFIEYLSNYSKEGDIIITDAGQTLSWTMQTWNVKTNQRLFSAFNHSPMGYALPASIGAYYALSERERSVIVIIGDGGFQMNLQELQTIKGYNLPIKIFVLNNKGYGMIKQTQSDWDSLQDGVACEPYIENLGNVAKAFGFAYYKFLREEGYKYLGKILDLTIPVICEIIIPDKTKVEPKLKYGDELIDLTPKISDDEKRKIENILKS